MLRSSSICEYPQCSLLFPYTCVVLHIVLLPATKLTLILMCRQAHPYWTTAYHSIPISWRNQGIQAAEGWQAVARH